MKKFNKGNLKVGQKVRLVDNRESIEDRIAQGFSSKMPRWFGEVVTIERIESAYVKVEENGWSWDLRFLEPVNEKPQSKVHAVTDFFAEDMILPCYYSINKVIENDNAVICFIEEEKTKKIIKTVAMCQNGDKFDLHKGVEICMYKTLRKIADKNLKRF